MGYELVYQDADCYQKRSFFFNLKSAKNFIKIYRYTMTQWRLYNENNDVIIYGTNPALYNNA